MYSDASRNFNLGFGAYCGSEWTYGQWDEQFYRVKQPSIEYLELFGVTVAVLWHIRSIYEKKQRIKEADVKKVPNVNRNDNFLRLLFSTFRLKVDENPKFSIFN